MKTATSTVALMGVSMTALPVFGQDAAVQDGWELLSKISVTEHYDDKGYRVTKVFPTEFQDGQEVFRLIGYAMPLTPPGQAVRSLMLVSDMGLCPFCGSGEHGGVLEVELDSPIDDFEEGARIEVVGTLERIDDPETWQAAILRGARVIDG